MPHDAAELVCPNTGQRLPENMRTGTRANVSSRMSEEPPPSRPPEPFSSGVPRTPEERQASPSRAPNEAMPFARVDRVSETPPEVKRRPSTIPPAQSNLIGQTLGGRYKIKGVLGEGGMGMVFDAEHLGLSRQVAIKVLSPSQAKKRVAVKRFQQEARAAGAIGHPNICEVYDLGLLDDGSPYLVMEKLVGQTLAERIAKEGGLPFDDVIEIVSQVLSGLAAAHEKGIVHRDIKPENIFLSRRPGTPSTIKLLDFGVSKMMAEFQPNNEESLDLTRTGMVMGTPYYMSPEQARGERNLDGRVDIYACGVVMYEALAGKRPFLAPNYNALLLAIINTTPKPLHEIRPATPSELEAIIARAMARNRNDRFTNAREMSRVLAVGGRESPSSFEDRKRPPIVAQKSDRPAKLEQAIRAQEKPNEGPNATLKSRRTDAIGQGNDARKPPPPVVFEPRPKRSELPLPPLRGSIIDGDSVEIPVHFGAGMDANDIPIDEDDETAVFDPSKPLRAAAARPRLAREPVPATKPLAIAAQQGPPARGSLPSPKPPPKAYTPARPLGSKPSPSGFPPPISPDADWEGETVVKRPDGSLPQPFNPERTMKLDGSELDRLENRPTPRRR